MMGNLRALHQVGQLSFSCPNCLATSSFCDKMIENSVAELVLGLGTSHSPQVSAPSESWLEFGEGDAKRAGFQYLGVDGETRSYDELLALADPDVRNELEHHVIVGKYRRIQLAVGLLAEELDNARADVVIVIGDDQMELFQDDGIPSIAIFGTEVLNFIPRPKESLASMPRGRESSLWATTVKVPEQHPGMPKLAYQLALSFRNAGIEITYATKQAENRSFGHAFTFVRKRLLSGITIPLLPITVNTYLPPNQPTAKRCLEIGKALVSGIELFPQNIRVAVVASGGLSHFVVNSRLDKEFLGALQSGDLGVITEIPDKHFRSGNSEILNWAILAGMAHAAGFKFKLFDYIPGYRSPAGTGCGMAFAKWFPPHK